MEDAVISYQKALVIQPDHLDARFNLGETLRNLGRLNEAVDSYQAILDLNPNDAAAHNELGNSLRDLGKLEAAVNSYQHALSLQPDLAMAHYNKGDTLQKLGRFEEAISCLEKANTSLSRANLLECIYTCEDKARFYQELDKISSEDSTNIGVAAISAFASNQFNRPDPYPFCNNPMDFVSLVNIISGDVKGNKFLDAISEQIFESKLGGGNQTLLKHGFQSAGSLFVDPRGALAELHTLLRDEITTYCSNRTASDCDYIRKWPQNYKLRAWYIFMQPGGYLDLHNHRLGWLSGVIYLQVPAKKGNEANIEFGLHGSNLPILHQDYPKKTYRVAAGDLVMFPSSLFHRTVPFYGQENRLCISFDVCPA